jgi:lipopolysaccharide assembly protein A
MFIIGIILGAAVVVFMLQNFAAVSISFLIWHFDGSLAIVVILAVVFGMLISWIFAIPDMLRLSQLKSHNKKLQLDLDVHKQKLMETNMQHSNTETRVVEVQEEG